MLIDSNDDERAYTRRYTENGINVLALDRHGRGLHRARPERHYPSARFARVEPKRAWLSAVIVVVLAAAALAAGMLG